MRSPIRANATDIDRWADQRDSQAILPKLIRRLVLASINRVERLHFRSDEGVQLGGWDGIVQVPTGNAFVPDGVSGWELSTSGDVKGRAIDNYQKRSGDPHTLSIGSTSFVFVTARRWPGKTGDEKERWAAEKRQEGIWKDVRAYDADDLETWLEQAHAVDIWFSTLIGKQPAGVKDVDRFWEVWSGATDPQLSLDLLIAGREEKVSEIHQWLRSEPSIIGLRADTRDEAVAYFTASLSRMPDDEREGALSRAIVVEDATAWDLLALCDSSLILIPTFPDRRMVAQAVRKGHHILIPLDRSESEMGRPLSIPRSRRAEVEKALIAMGLPEARARDSAALARRSLGALRRKIAIDSGILVPEWSKPEVARFLIPVLLAGIWDKEKIGDQEAIAHLAGQEYSKLQESLIQWNYKPDPPVRLVDRTWMMAAREDSWLLLARYITDDDLERFEAAILDVLGELDPQVGLSVSERLSASIRGIALKHSGHLRVGLAESLALMATFSDLYSSITMKGQAWADRIVRRLLDRSTDWHLWASLSPVLPLLAEAAPEIFLEIVEHDLSTPSPSLVNLFRDAKYDFGQSSPHTYLLWALEVLAWSPEYLRQSSLLLAKLAHLDPGGNLSNRPINSLREIFLIWHPCTAVNLEDQMKVLDAIRHKEPQVAWGLFVKLLPSTHDVAHSTAKPEYRNWVPDEEFYITDGELSKASSEIVLRLLEDVGTDGMRWRTLIELLDQLPKTEFDAIIDHLHAMDLKALSQPNQLQIWEALRVQLSHHLQFSHAKWALPQPAIELLQECYNRFEPEDPILKKRWLFSLHCDFIEAGHTRGRERENVINKARVDVVEELFGLGGQQMVLELIHQSEDPYLAGWALGKSRILDGQEEQILSQGLSSFDTALCNAAFGLLTGRAAVKGQEWLESLRLRDFWKSWNPQQRAGYYLCLPFSRQTWNDLETEVAETQHLYWSKVGIYGHSELEPAEYEHATRKLSEYGRLGTAVEFMGHYCSKLCHCPQLVADILDQFIQGNISEKMDLDFLSYGIGELLNLLEASGRIEETQLGHFEWYFLPLLRHHRPPKILIKTLSQNPEFFVELIKWSYRAEGEEPSEPTEEQRIRAHLSFDLLRDWRIPPGINEDGSVDPDKLNSWISRAHELAWASGRGKVADQHIGQVLVNYPAGTDGAWPHEAVRNLLENLESKDIEDGICAGVFNGRGCVMRSIGEGGIQERTVSERYRNFARILSDSWPRTASVMKKIAGEYEAFARHEDNRAELDEDLYK